MTASGYADSVCGLCSASPGRLLERILAKDIVELWGASQQPFVASCLEGLSHVEYLECEQCSLRYFWPTRTGNAAFYGSINEESHYYQAQKVEFENARDWLAGAESVLDVGAGEGRFSSSWPGRYLGVEPSAEAVERGRRAGRNLFCGTLDDWLLRGEPPAPAIVMFQVLEHVERPRSLLLSAHRALAEGGWLVVAVPAMEHYVGEATNAATNLPPHHVTHWTQRVLSFLPKVLPFDLVETAYTPLEEVHYVYANRVRMAGTLRRMLGWTPRQVDRTLRWKLLSTLASVVADAGAAKHRGGTPLEKGHTVMALYRRRTGAP